jgi:hypothetical protein
MHRIHAKALMIGGPLEVDACRHSRSFLGAQPILRKPTSSPLRTPFQRRAWHAPSVEQPTIFEAAGGQDAFLRLATAHRRRCLDDPALNHPFSHPGHPQHVETSPDIGRRSSAALRSTQKPPGATPRCLSSTRVCRPRMISVTDSWPASWTHLTMQAFPTTAIFAGHCGPTWSGPSAKSWPTRRPARWCQTHSQSPLVMGGLAGP